MQQRRLIELIKDYDCVVDYHPRKANVVVDTLSCKEKAMVGKLVAYDKKKKVIELKKFGEHIRIGSKWSMLAQHKVWLVFKDKVLKAQQNDGEVEKVKNKMKWGVETLFQVLKDIMLTMGEMMYLFNDKAFKKEILKHTHKSRFVIHQGSIKMYKDLKELYW